MRKVVFIGVNFPEKHATAAGWRMHQVIDVMIKANDEIYYLATNEIKCKRDFENIKCINIQLNSDVFDVLIKEINPKLVIFDRFITEEQYGWRVSAQCPDAIKILDTEDLHFLRNARQLAIKNNTYNYKDFLINDITLREIASIYRCDLTLVISMFEMQLLSEEFNIDESLLFYLPFLQNNSNHTKLQDYPSFSNRSHFMTIGNFRHQPNYNAVVYLKNNIWPLIKKKLPTAEMHVYGSYASEKVHQLQNSKDGFFIKGWIENSETAFINSKVCLAPIQFGAGLKGKLLEAMQFGTPSITTTIGAEGMHNNLNWNGFIENDDEKFAEKAVEIYVNEKLWLEAQQNGIKILNQCFSKEKYSLLFTAEIKNLLKNLKKHRQHNFIGLMLSHHKIKSTKYLSKWIEEKNKNL